MKQSKKGSRIFIIILMGWCMLFLRCRTAASSMIRAVILAKSEIGYHVGLLYHSQEPAADSSDVEAQVNVVWSGAATMERAFAQAEEQLPAQANYRLCDYLFLPVDVEYELMADYEKLVLEKNCGRIAARVGFLDLTSSEMEEETLLNNSSFCLMEIAAKHKKEMPYLYQWDELCLLPLFRIEEASDIKKNGAVLCSKPYRDIVEEEDECVIRLLMGISEDQSFWLEGERVSVRKCVVSVTLHPEWASLVLDCQPSYGANSPTQTQIFQLQDLCTKTVFKYWNRGVDLLNLKEKSALQRGIEAAISPEKNACPQLQTDVRFLIA